MTEGQSGPEEKQMRRTEFEGVLPHGMGRSPERPVSYAGTDHFRGRAADGADCLAAIGSRSVVLSRPVAGVSCRIRISPNQFEGVEMLADEGRCVVRLVHRDPGLTIELTETPDPQSAAEQRDDIAALLDLPVLGSGLRSIQPETRRVWGRLIKRPRFLKRRATGTAPAASPIAGREMIARH
jgi:hypothetical protein